MSVAYVDTRSSVRTSSSVQNQNEIEPPNTTIITTICKLKVGSLPHIHQTLRRLDHHALYLALVLLPDRLAQLLQTISGMLMLTKNRRLCHMTVTEGK